MTAQPKAGEPSRKLKWTVALSLLVILIGSSVFLALGGPTDLAKRPGIFGTKANLFSDLNLIAQIVLLAGLSLGAIFARRGNITAHQYNQTAWVLFNIVLTIFIMSVAYFQYVMPGLPGNLNQAFGLVSTIHAVLGLLAICCGVYLILRMNKLMPEKWRIKGWKGLMRLTLALYLLVGVLGLGIYYFWYMR
ncbi:MAG TPA: hypothetical protein VII92_14930 [Anaerolineae bacterium]